MQLNIYDFDKTIYRGDSTVDFYIYCLKRKPFIIVILPYQLYGIMKYNLGLCSKTAMKEYFFVFLKFIKDIDILIDDFSCKYKSKISKWYQEKNHDNDVIITASPEFIVSPLLSNINTKKIIASDTNKRTGKFNKKNCYGEEKVLRLYEAFSNKITVENFYSDSLSDLPLAKISKKAFLVKGNRIYEWKIDDKY